MRVGVWQGNSSETVELHTVTVFLEQFDENNLGGLVRSEYDLVWFGEGDPTATWAALGGAGRRVLREFVGEAISHTEY